MHHRSNRSQLEKRTQQRRHPQSSRICVSVDDVSFTTCVMHISFIRTSASMRVIGTYFILIVTLSNRVFRDQQINQCLSFMHCGSCFLQLTVQCLRDCLLDTKNHVSRTPSCPACGPSMRDQERSPKQRIPLRKCSTPTYGSPCGCSPTKYNNVFAVQADFSLLSSLFSLLSSLFSLLSSLISHLLSLFSLLSSLFSLLSSLSSLLSPPSSRLSPLSSLLSPLSSLLSSLFSLHSPLFSLLSSLFSLPSSLSSLFPLFSPLSSLFPLLSSLFTLP